VIKDVVQATREAIYDELMKLLDRFENQTLPILGLDRVSLDFGEIRYGQSVTLPIQVTNTGNVVAQFRLVPKLDEVRKNSVDTSLCSQPDSPILTRLFLSTAYCVQAMDVRVARLRHVDSRRQASSNRFYSND
jgi:hypothetical protein